MTEPITAPEGGDPQDNTPADGAANPPGQPEPAPPSQAPAPVPPPRQQGWDPGAFGKGKAKGVREALAALDLGEDIEAAAAQLESLRDLQAQGQTPEEREAQAREFRRFRKEHHELSEQVTRYKAQADHHLVSTLKAAALAGGVVPEMADDFVAVYQGRLRWGDNDRPEVLSPTQDGTLIPGGLSVDDLVAEVLQAKPYYKAARAFGGSGDNPERTEQPPRKPAPAGWDTRSLRERLAGK